MIGTTTAAQQNTGGITGWATGLMESLGAPGAGLAIALENVFPPLPSEVILPLAGFTAARGDMNLFAALLWTTAGSVVGALALYWVGALLGRERILAFASKVPLLKPADVERTESWFSRHGTKAVFFGRMIPVFRSLISVPAGVTRMPAVTFLTLTTLGSLLWNTAFVLAGYLLGENWDTVADYVSMYSKAVLAIIVVAVVGFVAVRLKRARRDPG
ncbi:DedA family protein [Streptomyces sp. TRM43335]|uniref:DedA family protein n=1 Tax=Streptomyces taklimakanensis TaxID=2569853 RepID=A0A6G2BJJ0_9ACTN|nr:DedA family protein [Streptomyces taklimakanensis]MTE22223.1 DedA family protein [Streptomyces taklimakanensis]